MASLGGGELQGMADSAAKGIEESVDEQVIVSVDVKPSQTEYFIEPTPEEPEEALKPRMMSIPPAQSR